MAPAPSTPPQPSHLNLANNLYRQVPLAGVPSSPAQKPTLTSHARIHPIQLDFGRPLLTTAFQLHSSSANKKKKPEKKPINILPVFTIYTSVKMKFAVATALFASAVLAESTVYETRQITITSCAATVTNCPARSTVTSTSMLDDPSRLD
jgi:hypothetical protein